MRSRTLLLLPSLLAACGAAPQQGGADFVGLGISDSFVPPLPGLYCSGQMTREQFDRLPAAGIRRVVSLRAADEEGTGWEEARARQVGLEFVRIEIGGDDDLTRENAERLGAALAPQMPTLITCRTANRVGAMMAIKAFQDGAPADKALQLGKQCGLTRLEPAVRKRLGV